MPIAAAPTLNQRLSGRNSLRWARLACVLVIMLPGQSALCAAETPPPGPLRTNEPIYQNPFDLASGGASLTRATQDGVLFSNPSLPAFGRGFLRWIFFRTGFHLGSEAVDMALDFARKKKLEMNSELVDRALKTPVFGGVDFSLGFVTANGGGGAFLSGRADIAGRQFGSQGLPELRTRAYLYGGAISAGSVAFGDWLAIGAATRYQANAEVYKSIGLMEILQGSKFLDNAKSSLAKGYGLGVDLGATLQARSKHLDLRVAGTVNDLGTTKFTGGLHSWRETWNAGAGFTIHAKKDAVHCSADLRDLQRAYDEHWTRRFYTGCKAVFHNIWGMGAGLYQGWPTFGGVLNLWLMRLEAGTYTKEMGTQAGIEGRRVYFLAMGAEFP